MEANLKIDGKIIKYEDPKELVEWQNGGSPRNNENMRQRTDKVLRKEGIGIVSKHM